MSGTASYATPAPTRSPVMTHHHLHSSPETCHWGFFEAKLKPVLTIASGDEVTIDTISGGPDVVPDRNRFHVPPELAEVHAKSERMVPGHILTGPVAVDRRRTRRRAGSRNSRRQAPAGLGLQSDPAARRHAARRFPRDPAVEYSARSNADGGPAAVGARSAAGAVFRRHGRGAAAGLGPHHLADPARDGRQSRQQGTDAGRKTLSAGVCAGRAVFLRRRPWRPGRRRGLRHRDRNRAAGTFQADAAQGFAARLSPRRNARRTT